MVGELSRVLFYKPKTPDYLGHSPKKIFFQKFQQMNEIGYIQNTC